MTTVWVLTTDAGMGRSGVHSVWATEELARTIGVPMAAEELQRCYGIVLPEQAMAMPAGAHGGYFQLGAGRSVSWAEHPLHGAP